MFLFDFDFRVRIYLGAAITIWKVRAVIVLYDYMNNILNRLDGSYVNL